MLECIMINNNYINKNNTLLNLRRKLKLYNLIDYETGKTIGEAPIDISEAPKEYISSDFYTYELKHQINNVAFYFRKCLPSPTIENTV